MKSNKIMKIEYKTTFTKVSGRMITNSVGLNFEREWCGRYKAVRTDFCCKEIEEAFTDEPLFYFGFGNPNPRFMGDYGFPQVTISYNDSSVWDSYEIEHHTHIPIMYCPFCGAKIECVEIKRVKLITHEKQVSKTGCETITETEEVELKTNKRDGLKEILGD